MYVCVYQLTKTDFCQYFFYFFLFFIFFRLMLLFWLMFCSCFQALFIMHEPDSGLVIISNVLDLQHQAQRLKGGSRQHIQPVIWAAICLSRALWVSNQTRQRWILTFLTFSPDLCQNTHSHPRLAPENYKGRGEAINISIAFFPPQSNPLLLVDWRENY